jgi:hypothetical protein
MEKKILRLILTLCYLHRVGKRRPVHYVSTVSQIFRRHEITLLTQINGLSYLPLHVYRKLNKVNNSHRVKNCHAISVAIDRVMDWWPDLLDSLIHNSWLHFINHCHTKTTAHSRIFTSRCLIAAFNGGLSPSHGFPNCPRTHQLLTATSNSGWTPAVLWLTNSPTNSPTSWPTISSTNSSLTHSIVLLITSRHGPRRKHRSSVAVQLLLSCMFVELLPSNGCNIVAYFAVVA